MTVVEFKNAFNILFDGVASNDAPALDDYEISFFLTKAQEDLVKQKVEPLIRKLNGNNGFETTTVARVELKNLIKEYNTTLQQATDKNIKQGSQFFIIPSDTMYIIWEQGVVKPPGCTTDQYIDIVPKTHDEYNVQIKNPFKRPYIKQIWRMDYNAIEFSNNVVELVSEYPITGYRMRYIKYPLPIIISNLTSLPDGAGLSLNGKTLPSTSELDQSVHSKILELAVEYAVAAYRQNNLQTMIQLNSRNN